MKREIEMPDEIELTEVQKAIVQQWVDGELNYDEAAVKLTITGMSGDRADAALDLAYP
jgi:hypothetical protein